MGMYTEVLIRATFPSDTPIRPVLEHMFNYGPLPEILPDHEFFSKPRWRLIGHCSSFYHHPAIVNSWLDQYGTIHLFSRSDLKNYDHEIAAFFDWIMPHVEEPDGVWIGYSLYEEDDAPTLVFVKREPA